MFLMLYKLQKGRGSQWNDFRKAAQKILNRIKTNIINPFPFRWLNTTMTITPTNTVMGSIVMVTNMKNQSKVGFEAF